MSSTPSRALVVATGKKKPATKKKSQALIPGSTHDTTHYTGNNAVVMGCPYYVRNDHELWGQQQKQRQQEKGENDLRAKEQRLERQYEGSFQRLVREFDARNERYEKELAWQERARGRWLSLENHIARQINRPSADERLAALEAGDEKGTLERLDADQPLRGWDRSCYCALSELIGYSEDDHEEHRDIRPSEVALAPKREIAVPRERRPNRYHPPTGRVLFGEEGRHRGSGYDFDVKDIDVQRIADNAVFRGLEHGYRHISPSRFRVVEAEDHSKLRREAKNYNFVSRPREPKQPTPDRRPSPNRATNIRIRLREEDLRADYHSGHLRKKDKIEQIRDDAIRRDSLSRSEPIRFRYVEAFVPKTGRPQHTPKPQHSNDYLPRRDVEIPRELRSLSIPGPETVRFYIDDVDQVEHRAEPHQEAVYVIRRGSTGPQQEQSSNHRGPSPYPMQYGEESENSPSRPGHREEINYVKRKDEDRRFRGRDIDRHPNTPYPDKVRYEEVEECVQHHPNQRPEIVYVTTKEKDVILQERRLKRFPALPLGFVYEETVIRGERRSKPEIIYVTQEGSVIPPQRDHSPIGGVTLSSRIHYDASKFANEEPRPGPAHPIDEETYTRGRSPEDPPKLPEPRVHFSSRNEYHEHDSIRKPDKHPAFNLPHRHREEPVYDIIPLPAPVPPRTMLVDGHRKDTARDEDRARELGPARPVDPPSSSRREEASRYRRRSPTPARGRKDDYHEDRDRGRKRVPRRPANQLIP